MQYLILAGGFATRLWPLTEKRAKPLLPLAGKPVITHIVEKLPQDANIHVLTNAAYTESFRQWRLFLPKRDITIHTEHTRSDDEKLGALGAVAQWITAKTILEDLVLLTGDNYYGFAMKDFLQQYEQGVPLLAAYDIGNTEAAKQFGTVLLKADQKTIAAFEEKPTEPKTTLISTGCSIVPKAYLSELTAFAAEKPDNIGGLFTHFVEKDIPIHCFRFTEPWFDIGSFSAYLNATKMLVGDTTKIADTALVSDAECEHTVVVGERTRVRQSACDNVVIFDNCTIESCVLRDCVIDNNCTLRGIDLTGKMLREGTELIAPS